MLLSLGTKEFRLDLVKISQTVEELEVDDDAITKLREMGVDYIYIGQMGDFSGPGMDGAQLTQSPDLQTVYHNSDVYIFEIGPQSGNK